MDCINLAKLYACGEFSDCTLISSSGDEFEAHRLLLGQYPCFKHLLTEHRRVQLSEPTEVVERMLRWLYGVEWAPANIQSTRKDIGQELADIMNLCDAAKKYEIPKLSDDAYATVGRVLSEITSMEAGLHVLRDLVGKQGATRALERTLIDRLFTLLPKQGSDRYSNNKRPREHDADRLAASMAIEDGYPEVITVPKKSARVKTPSMKSRDPPPSVRKKSAVSLQAKQQPTVPKLHCTCRQPEDPYMVECEGCDRWFHPGCIGKGKYARSTYRSARRFALQGDEKRYREENLSFTCLDCDQA